MNDAELNQILKNANPPERPADYWQEFPAQVQRQLNRPLPPQRGPMRWWPRLAWTGAIATACVIGGFLMGHRFAGIEIADDHSQILQSQKLIQEVTAMFPNRVRAIVKTESEWQLILSDDANVPASTPLWVEVRQGGRCTTLVTFSGQEVQVAGQKMTVLADAGNGVILVGDRFAWSSADSKAGLRDLKIQARPLQMALR